MLEDVGEVLHSANRIFITTHIRPDGDALGSQLALGRLLERLGKSVTMINSDPPPYTLEWLPGIKQVETFDGALNQRERIAVADAIVVVDTNALERIGKVAGPIQNSAAPKVLIDHHTHPEGWFDVQWVDETASSTGELIYQLIAAEDDVSVDFEMATALYTAIMTDTGSFRFSNVKPQTHRIIAALMEEGGIVPDIIHAELFDKRSRNGLRLLSRALEGITMLHDGQVGYMAISQQMVREVESDLSETEGFVNYILSIEGVKAAVLFSETASGTKASFRSKGDAHVHEWARAFGGGGHRNASGAFVKGNLDDVVDQVMGAAAKFLNLEAPETKEDEDLSQDDASYLASLLARQS